MTSQEHAELKAARKRIAALEEELKATQLAATLLEDMTLPPKDDSKVVKALTR